MFQLGEFEDFVNCLPGERPNAEGHITLVPNNRRTTQWNRLYWRSGSTGPEFCIQNFDESQTRFGSPENSNAE